MVLWPPYPCHGNSQCCKWSLYWGYDYIPWATVYIPAPGPSQEGDGHAHCMQYSKHDWTHYPSLGPFREFLSVCRRVLIVRRAVFREPQTYAFVFHIISCLVQVSKIVLYERQGYVYCTQSMIHLPMASGRKELDHPELWHWAYYTGLN